ncbi:Uncharacterised protein [Salmonella enterica subsp. enterica serovar Typhimurium str. DT104]|nr:Uncharacterised protein [Salmonella enterica subsp. enterica serovar Typhimurium str. DT104]
MRARQRRDGSQLTVFFAQFIDRTKVQRPQRAGFDANRFLTFRHPVITAIALGHMTFGRVVLRRAVRAGHVAVAATDTDLFVHHHKTVIALVHRAARADFGAGRVFAVVTGDGEIVGKDVLVPDAVIFLPVTARILINAAEADVGSEIFVVLAGQFAGFATGATTGINKKSILGCHRLLLTPFQPERGSYVTGSPSPAEKDVGSSVR